MSSPDKISEDDESFNLLEYPETSGVSNNVETIELSSDDGTDFYYTSDEDSELPAVELRKVLTAKPLKITDLQERKSAAIKNLFADSKNRAQKCKPDQDTELRELLAAKPLQNTPLQEKKSAVIKNLFADSKNRVEQFKHVPQKVLPSMFKNRAVKKASISSLLHLPKPPVPGFEKMISGIKVCLPVDPYGSQMVLMYKMIQAMIKGQNCLLESPTGSGKTLALLCAALAWQSHERNTIAASQAQQFCSYHPELELVEGAVDYVASPINSNAGTPEKFFARKTFGEQSIYDEPGQSNTDGNQVFKRMEPEDICEDFPDYPKVTIHKKRKLDTSFGESSKSIPAPKTPEKTIKNPQPETPENIKAPIIYYGARTHKQLQQVIKEFGRTAYCGEAAMSLLSSREYSCTREFDKAQWGTKNDMCKKCTRTFKPKDEPFPRTNCQYYDNRKSLDHSCLPPAFDLEDLVKTGEELMACPFYAARSMAQNSSIVFCPYNYLIDPGIRSSLQIDLTGCILVIDEAHNIEDICRDAATFTITRTSIGAAILEVAGEVDNRFSNTPDVANYLVQLLRVLRSWDTWFVNQLPLVNNKPLNNNEAQHVWEIPHFIQTLNNHNIGEANYSDFVQGAEQFLQKYRDEPNQLSGITKTTAGILESLSHMLRYLFGDDGKQRDDFRPSLIKTVSGTFDSDRRASFMREKEVLSLRFLCMNPAIVFAGLKKAKCIILASGTLTPLISLHSELATEFPLQVSPNHVIPADRVWIGSLTTCPNGAPLECTSRGTDTVSTQDALGECVQWVCRVTPNGVLCFLPSYALINKLCRRWEETKLWDKLNELKHVFVESRNVRDHNDIMEDYYKYTATSKGALLFAVYRGKVSEGMDFKDHQARAVITVGVPYPNTFDMAVKEKMKYNDKYSKERNLLSSREWLRVQAYRALNQAVGRCVRHRNDWGAVLLIDARFRQPYYTEHLSKWVRNFLGNNQHTYESLVNSSNSLESFMNYMTIRDTEDAYTNA